MTNGLSGTPRSNEGPAEARRLTLPKARRLLKRAEFRQVYDQGFKVPSSCFVAFCYRAPEADGPKVGFTTPGSLGKAVIRNRMRRRLRETVRRRLWQLGPNWRIVWNLRGACLNAPQSVVDRDVERVLLKCKD